MADKGSDAPKKSSKGSAGLERLRQKYSTKMRRHCGTQISQVNAKFALRVLQKQKLITQKRTNIPERAPKVETVETKVVPEEVVAPDCNEVSVNVVDSGCAKEVAICEAPAAPVEPVREIQVQEIVEYSQEMKTLDQLKAGLSEDSKKVNDLIAQFKQQNKEYQEMIDYNTRKIQELNEKLQIITVKKNILDDKVFSMATDTQGMETQFSDIAKERDVVAKKYDKFMANFVELNNSTDATD